MSNTENARRFVQRLASDDAFRKEVESDAVTAAAAYGFQLDPASLPEAGVKLPPKDLLAAQSDDVARRFADNCDIVIHFVI